MTLDVLKAPLRELFTLSASDTLEQWYYANDSTFLPNRRRDVLMLTPVLSVQDKDTNRTYSPSFYGVRWFYQGTGDEDYSHEILNTTDDGTAEYVKLSDGRLMVKKNVTPDNPVGILCELTYIDPRDAGVTYTVKDKVLLATNRAANADIPVVDIEAPTTVLYNPFSSASSRFTLRAKVTLKGSDITSTAAIRWYAFDGQITQETLIDAVDSPVAKFPCYVSGQGTATLVLDAMYTERVTVVARVLNTSTNQLYPTKAYRTLTWDGVAVDVKTVSDNGSDVRDTTQSKTFRNIVNLKGRTLTDQQVSDNFTQVFKIRKASKTTGGVTPTDTVETIAQGTSATVSGDKLRRNGSSEVFSELTMKGPWCVIVHDGKAVVLDGTSTVIVERD